MAYCEVASTGSKSPHDDVWPFHASVRTEAKAHPACRVDYQFECYAPLQVVKAPLQADQMVLVQVLHEGYGGVRRPCSFGPEQAEERKQRAHDVSVKVKIFKLSSMSAQLPDTLPPSSSDTPALLDERKWYREKVLSHLAFAPVEQQIP